MDHHQMPGIDFMPQVHGPDFVQIGAWLFVVGIPIFALVFGVIGYNRLVRLRNSIQESWSNVDTELRRRYDLIPNLVKTVRGYASHERSVLQDVTRARTKAVNSTGDPEQQAIDENSLVQALSRLFALAEAYPNLKADRNFLSLQQELVNTEDRIQAARRFFNANVRDYNNAVQSFPSNIVAGAFGFQRKSFFEVGEAQIRAAVSTAFDRQQ
jgi:LemA protein